MSTALIAGWHRHELSVPYPGVSGARLLMGCPLWGPRYIEKFLNYGLPSILSSRDALNAYGWELVLYVDAATWHALCPAIYGYRIPVQMRCIPEQIMDIVRQDGEATYRVLACVHNGLVAQAGRCGSAFHMLVADILYSEGYFERLIKLTSNGYGGITQAGLTASFGSAAADIDAHRGPDGVLRIAARNLGQITWDHMAPEWRSWGMTGIDDPMVEMPNAHLIHWRGSNSIRIHSAHQSAVWMDAQRCRAAGTDVGGTIDSELPRYVGSDYYIPTVVDGLAYVALEDSCKGATPRTTWADWKAALLAHTGGRDDKLAYFKTPCVLPALPMDGYPSDQAIDAQYQAIVSAI